MSSLEPKPPPVAVGTMRTFSGGKPQHDRGVVAVHIGRLRAGADDQRVAVHLGPAGLRLDIGVLDERRLDRSGNGMSGFGQALRRDRRARRTPLTSRLPGRLSWISSAPSAAASPGDSICGSGSTRPGNLRSQIASTASRSPAIERDRLAAEADAAFGQRRLVGEGGMVPKRLRPGMSARGEHGDDARMPATKAARSPNAKRARWCGERTTSTDSASAGKPSAPKLSLPVTFGSAVEPDRRRADGLAAGGQCGGRARGTAVRRASPRSMILR